MCFAPSRVVFHWLLPGSPGLAGISCSVLLWHSFTIKAENPDLLRPGVRIFMHDSSHSWPRVDLLRFFPRPMTRNFLVLIVVTGQRFVALSFMQIGLVQPEA